MASDVVCGRASPWLTLKKIADIWQFHDHIWPFVRLLLNSLNLNWYKSYDNKHKKAKNAKDENVCFCTKLQKKEMEIFAFLVITFEPILSKNC